MWRRKRREGGDRREASNEIVAGKSGLETNLRKKSDSAIDDQKNQATVRLPLGEARNVAERKNGRQSHLNRAVGIAESELEMNVRRRRRGNPMKPSSSGMQN